MANNLTAINPIGTKPIGDGIQIVFVLKSIGGDIAAHMSGMGMPPPSHTSVPPTVSASVPAPSDSQQQYSRNGVYHPVRAKMHDEIIQHFVHGHKEHPEHDFHSEFAKPREEGQGAGHAVFMMGGSGCVGGETILAGRPIRDWVADQTTPTLIATLFGRGVPEVPYLKGYAPLYRVVTQSGREVVVTEQHQFLSPTGWHPLATLSVGSLIAAGDNECGSESSGISTNSQGDCFWGSHPYDELPPPVVVAVLSKWRQLRKTVGDNSASVLDVLPSTVSSYLHEVQIPIWNVDQSSLVSIGGESSRLSLLTSSQCLGTIRPQGNALQYPQSKYDFFATDSQDQDVCHENKESDLLVQGHTQTPLPLWLDSLIVEMQQALLHMEHAEVLDVAQVVSQWEHLMRVRHSELESCYTPIPLLSDTNSDVFHTPKGLSAQVIYDCSHNHNTTFWDSIKYVEFLRVDEFFDIGVPGPEHYLAQGLWHHNSGKSYYAAKKFLKHPRFGLVDADEIKAHLATREGRPGHHNVDSSYYHEESSDLSKRMQHEMHGAGRSYVFDGTGANPNSLAKKMQAAKDAGYKVHLHYAYVPVDTAIKRDLARPRSLVKQGREDVLRGIHASVRDSFLKVRHLADKVRVFDNSAEDVYAPNLYREKRLAKIKAKQEGGSGGQSEGTSDNVMKAILSFIHRSPVTPHASSKHKPMSHNPSHNPSHTHHPATHHAPEHVRVILSGGLEFIGSISDGHLHVDDEIYNGISTRRILGEKPEFHPIPVSRLEAKGAKFEPIAGKSRGHSPLHKAVEGAPTAEQYHADAMRNLARSSRTANGVVDTSASAGKAGEMAVGSGQEAANLANANFSKTVMHLHGQRNRSFHTTQDVLNFADDVNRRVNHGIVKDGTLLRKDDSEKYPYTKAEHLGVARRQFAREFKERLDRDDPKDTAAWIHWRVNMTDHPYADGVGKTAEALSHFALMRHNHPLHEMPEDRKEFFQHGNTEVRNPHNPESYGGEQWENFRKYFHSRFPK